MATRAKSKSTVEHRRRVRALEAKRDSLITQGTKTKVQLATVRAELKQVRKQGAK